MARCKTQQLCDIEAEDTVKVRFHLRGWVAEPSPQCGADFWGTVFSCCVFPLRRGGGGTEAGVRGGSAGMGPGAIFPLRRG